MYQRRQQIKLPATPDAPGRARRALDRAVGGELPTPVLQDARLLTSELVTNSIVHAGLSPRQDIELVVSLTPTRVRVEVADPGDGHPRVPSAPNLHQSSGWGLHFVAHLADRWGVGEHAPKRVWFEVDLTPAEQRSA